MKKHLIVFLFLLGPLFVQGQQLVSGKVILSRDGSDLPGVNVTVKGSTTGTVTDIQGRFKIIVPNESATVVFSFIGLETQEILVKNNKKLEVEMTADTKQLGQMSPAERKDLLNKGSYRVVQLNRNLLICRVG